MIGHQVINCMTLNVARLLNPLKRRRLAKYITKEQINVIYIQETHLKESESRYLKEFFSRTIYHVAASSSSKGVMLQSCYSIIL